MDSGGLKLDTKTRFSQESLCPFGIAVTLWIEQKKEETIKGYRSPLITYRTMEGKL